ncbi:leucine-rich repeat-containing protein 43 isoform X1 [Corvus hawaiiensis]|uniref:leucine-rich repeat-containing protein 43 isoform X1 n=1 Tax=Corvus hawaiiensis TaxID=134902 RepID=UPI00201A193F|nr:leucine-rich repeat-containing protein 43 isoform X1 [Corvus hawaiiensis]
MAAPGSVSAAFQEYLRHLGLQDFPCGLGSWVRVWGGTAMGYGTGLPLPLLSPCPQNKSCLNAEPAGLEETVLPGEETPEVLLELLRDQHSPWALPHDCSPQDRLLREVAVLAPELLRSSRVFQVVKSLRILDKGVSAAAGAHKAVGQETVSSCCEGKHPGRMTPSSPRVFPGVAAGTPQPPQDIVLICVTWMSRGSTSATRCLRDTLAKPSSLQVEEVDEGVLRFQQLEELILSANRISKVTSAHLPRALKVLELCCNAVHDLQDLCARPPPELQHLGLGYNRLCGPSQEKHFTVDFWPNLISLDLSFNSLTDLQGLVSQLSTLQNLRILVLQGNPLALIPSYRGFLVDSLPKLSILDDIHIRPDERQQFHGLARQPELIRNEGRVVVSIGEMKGLPDPKAFQQLKVGSEGPIITYSYRVTYEFAEREELEDRGSPEVTQIYQSPTVATLDVDSSAQDTGEAKSHQESAATEEPKAHSAKVFATPGQPWADTIDFSYRKEHVAKDLVGLKSYLEAGTIVSVVEEKVLSWPVDADAEENAATNKKEGQELKKDSAKDKQKKKKQPCEFRSDPPIRSILGTRRVTLKTLLATENMVAAVCEFGILIPQKPPEPPAVEEKEVKKGTDKSKTPKAVKGAQASRKTATSPKGKGKNKDTAEVAEGQELQPVLLTVQFQMQLLRWPLAASTQSQENVAVAVGNTQ